MLGGAKSVRPSFISYVQSIPSETESLKQVEPSLLPGEVVIAEASDVFKCNSSEENGQRLRGTLICTTLKVSFLPNLSLDEQQESLYKNRLLGEHDVSLTCVDQLHAVHDGKKKQLLPSSGIKYSPEVLIIHCKNFRIIKFYFENTDQNESRKLINAIVYHCHPSSLRLLFAFEFLQASPTEVYPVKGRTRETGVKHGESPVSMVQHSDQNISESSGRLGPFSNNSGTTLFESPEDWEFEMTRAKAIGWRVTRVNEAFKISKSLPEFFVVSSLLRDSDVKEAAVHFQDERGPFALVRTLFKLLDFGKGKSKGIPLECFLERLSHLPSAPKFVAPSEYTLDSYYKIWIWSHTSGASLIKMAKLRSDTEQIGQEQRMLSTLPMPHLGTPYVADLSKELPDLPEVQAAFLKLKHICMQDTAEAFWLSDNKWLSSLENTGWLECIWQCLRISAKLAEEMTNNGHVVIREIDCRDMCCVVASLVQVLLDAQSRTIVGFQSLIQKEWVLAGHRFLDRLNHLQLDVGEAPVFQLFLDCMWQLLQQNPETFEFGETYLTVLSDSTRIPLFGTFLFNSQYQRDTESLESKAERYIRTDYKSARLPSVWDWSLQFGPEAQWLLRNPQFVQEKPTVTQRHLPLETFGALGRKNSSSPMALLQSLRKGVLGEDGDTFRKGSLRHLRTPRHSYSSEELRMVATPPGLLSPCLASPLLRLWEQCYLRWLPQIPILGGGSVVAKQRLACLRQEIEVLHARLNTLQDMATPTESSLDQHLNNRCPLELSLQPSSEYSPGTPDSLFSTFPFVPTGILSHRTVPITPLSRLLFGRSASGEALAVDDYNGRI